MKSVRRVFEKIRAENPLWSSFLCFANAVRGKHFSRRTILRNFNALVDEKDYARNEKKEIVDFLVELSESG